MAADATCTVNITFKPTSSTPLIKSQTLNITVATPATSQSISLTGNVVVPTYAVTPTAVAFANQTINTTSAAKTVTISNTGTVALPLTNVTITGTNANRFTQTNTCGTFPSTMDRRIVSLARNLPIHFVWYPLAAAEVRKLRPAYKYPPGDHYGDRGRYVDIFDYHCKHE